ncbi:heme-binding protein, partial [Chloroflexota bacterium]
AAQMRRDSGKIHEDFKARTTWYSGIRDFIDSNLTPMPGGICLRAPDGTVLGGIGISGRGSSQNKTTDIELGEIGAKALSL